MQEVVAAAQERLRLEGGMVLHLRSEGGPQGCPGRQRGRSKSAGWSLARPAECGSRSIARTN
jgi:hypothetical protein